MKSKRTDISCLNSFEFMHDSLIIIHFNQSIPADLYIINFIRGCKYNLEKVKRKLDCTMTMRGALPEFFSGWNPFAPELQAILKLGYNFLLFLCYHVCHKLLHPNHHSKIINDQCQSTSKRISNSICCFKEFHNCQKYSTNYQTIPH